MKLFLAIPLMAIAAWPASTIVSLRTLPAQTALKGADATQQFIAIAKYADGSERDVTSDAEWRLSKPACARFISTARIAASADGTFSVTAMVAGRQASSSVRIEEATNVRPVSFTREISGILTKRGCNGAACHGGVKGQGGLKLSANALHPEDDYNWIMKGGAYQVLTAEVKGERVPRIDLANPEKSLLLLKPTMAIAHGGGKRFSVDSDDYKTIIGWIRSGAPLQQDGPALRSLRFHVWRCILRWRLCPRKEFIVSSSPPISAMGIRKTTLIRRSTLRTIEKSHQ